MEEKPGTKVPGVTTDDGSHVPDVPIGYTQVRTRELGQGFKRADGQSFVKALMTPATCKGCCVFSH